MKEIVILNNDYILWYVNTADWGIGISYDRDNYHLSITILCMSFNAYFKKLMIKGKLNESNN
jgi:hypothetical protein